MHDAASRIASQVNNDGVDAQIAFLIEQLGASRTEQIISSANDPDT